MNLYLSIYLSIFLLRVPEFLSFCRKKLKLENWKTSDSHIYLNMSDDWQARLFASSIGSIVAECVTLPTDVAKVRLQIQKIEVGGSARYDGLTGCVRTIAAEEGPRALWKGLTPALVRQVCYTGLAMVIYEPIRNTITNGNENPSFFQRLLAGGTAGALSITCFNPTEVLKTQIQTATESKSMISVIRRVFKNEGILGFWAGLYPNVTRTFLVNAAELGT